jgi:AraC-like DNA-binding protein
MNENFSAETVSSVAQVAELIRSQPGRDLSVTEMANLTGFSETHFRTLFKQLYHLSPKEFQTQCRLELALQQLCQSHKSVSDVADYLGFETVSSFSTWFRKLVHMSPSEWRDGQRRTVQSREY